MRSPILGLLALAACNAPPEALQVTISPKAPATTDDLVAEITGAFTDADGDEVSYGFTWYRDGVAQPQLTDLTVPASETTKHQEWKLFVQPTDGRLEGPPSEAVVTILNTPPSAELTLAPEIPLTTEDVTATINGTDPDGDDITFSYTWTLNGTATGYQDATLPASATERGDIWTLTVTPNDGEADGEPALASVSIENTAPQITTVTLAPTDPREGDEITASVTTLDDDGDEVSLHYRWFADEERVLEGEHPTLGDTYFTKHQQISVEVTPNDGFVDGGPMESDAVTVLNTSPSISGASVEPHQIYEATTVNCVGEDWDDVDGDAEGYQVTWYVDGVEAGSVACDDGAVACLDGTVFDKDQNISCTLVPDDGEEQGIAVTSDAVTVLNTAPEISHASLSHTSPVEGDTITVSVTASDADGDALSYSYAWFVDSVEAATTSSLGSALFDKHQVIHADVTPNDGSEDGATVTSAIATAVNSPPEITSLQLSPSALYTDEVVIAEVATTDADGDTVTLSYAWTVDGTDPGVTTSSLDGGDHFDKHQVVAVTVIPNDGEDDGGAAGTSTSVHNSPPTAPELAVIPEEPEAEVDDIICSIVTDSTDADGDSVSYSFTWDVDGVAYVAGGTADAGDTGWGWVGPTATTETDDTVTGEDTWDDAVWTCSVTPSDGEDDGTAGTVSVSSEYLVDPQVSCGRRYCCFLDQFGQLTCWGDDSYGQASPPTGTYTALSAGDYYHACAIDLYGQAHCWGDPSDDMTSAPTDTLVAISAGGYHTSAIDTSGQLVCWGKNLNAQCSSAPSGSFIQIDSGESGTCGVDATNQIQCWGRYDPGTPPSGSFQQVSLADYHACALDMSNEVQCWGSDRSGSVSDPSGAYCFVGVGERYTCGLACSGAVDCWGDDSAGPGIESPPTDVYSQISTGDYTACGLVAGNLVRCWGDDSYGQASPPSDIAAP